MDYLTVAQTAERWGVSARRVHSYLKSERINGAVRFGSAWMIPSNAKKPRDPRGRVDSRGHADPHRDLGSAKKKKPEHSLSDELSYILDATTHPAPQDHPDAVVGTLTEKRLRLHYEGELAYLRGDFERTIDCFRKTEGDEASRLRACPVTIAAAISVGNYPFYLEIESFLKAHETPDCEKEIIAFAQLSLATAHTGAFAPNMAPDWLKSGDFSFVYPSARPDAAYKRAKYFQCLGRYESMLDVAQTALSFCAPYDGVSFHDIYFRVACAIACYALERAEEAKQWLRDAMNIALPHGFITPFAESAPAFGGLLEWLLQQEFPFYYEAVMAQWKRTYVNWLTFHNRFTKDNITLILSLRDYEIASLAAHGVPYAKIARQFGISVGRLNNIMQEICGKLFVSGKKELAKYIL